MEKVPGWKAEAHSDGILGRRKARAFCNGLEGVEGTKFPCNLCLYALTDKGVGRGRQIKQTREKMKALRVEAWREIRLKKKKKRRGKQRLLSELDSRIAQVQGNRAAPKV